MRRVLLALIGVLLGWLAATSTGAAAAAAAPAGADMTYTYDSHNNSAVSPHASFERGPPATYDSGATCDPVDRRSHGSAAGTDSASMWAIATYGHAATLVQIARATTTTASEVQLADGDLCALGGSQAAAKSVDEAGALVKYDPMAASRNLLGQVGDGYAVTPGGRTISAHAAERIALGGPGRPPTTLARVDDILNNPTGLKYDPLRDTVKVMQGKDFVVVSGTGSQHIVTVMVR